MSSLALILAIVFCELVGMISGLAASAKSTWFRKLKKPSWNPPSWLFAPVWIMLYAMMGISLYLVWMAPSSPLRTVALSLFLIQLALNFIWSPLFFRIHSLLAAGIDIIALVAVLLVTIIVFWQAMSAAALLLIPYLLWTSFAAALTWKIWQLNS